MSAIDDAAQLIRRSQAIAIATHAAPDPDAIGSLLGLGTGLRAYGKKVALLCDDAAPPTVDFLPGLDEVAHPMPDGFKPDLFIGVDASDTERLGSIARPLLNGSIPILNIDHHITNLNFGDVNVVVPTASSCAEVLVPVLDALGINIDTVIATYLMTGLVGDTRGFSTSNVTSETLLTAARLLEAGADLAAISERVLRRHSMDGLRLWGLALSNIHLDQGIAWVIVPLKERKGANIPDISDLGLSSLLLSVPEAHISAAFTEQEGGKVDVSMRARPGYDVASLALSLGGGGHPAAAGCTIDGPLDAAVERVIGLLKTAGRAG